MTDWPGPTLRQRVAVLRPTAVPTLDEQIADLEHRLVDFHDRPRIAQAIRADERLAMENDLADLRRRRDAMTDDEPLDAA
jgi:hypothetical protein